MNYNISKAPELEWLKANSVNGTPEGVDTVGKEYKRTWCSIELFNAVLEDNYEAFSACQPETTRITRESFSEIRTYVKSALKTADDENAMRAFLVINDLGKVGDFVEKIADSFGFKSVDHDKILYEGLKAHPEFSPTFSALADKYQQIILTGLKTAFNMGQYVQCECLPANLAPLTDIDAVALNYYMIHVLFDIAGAAGHVNSNGSLICNELYWKKFSWALETIICMVNGKCGPKEAYGDYLTKTMDFYKVSSPVIAKLCNLVRVSTSEEADELRVAFDKLIPETKSNLEKELMATGIGSDTAILMYYAPATFQNALSYYKKVEPETAIAKTIQNVAPVMSHIYKHIRAMEERSEGVVMAFIADIAKAAMKPEKLMLSSEIQRVGNDFIVTRGGYDVD